MSLVAIAASAALAAAAQPAHTVSVEHRGGTYQVAYRPVVETRLRTIGMAAGWRPSTQRCIVSADVTVQRVITPAQGGHDISTVLPERKSFTQQLPGSCHNRAGEADKLVARKASDVSVHLAQLASSDRPAALAMIDSAHHFAAN